MLFATGGPVDMYYSSIKACYNGQGGCPHFRILLCRMLQQTLTLL